LFEYQTIELSLVHIYSVSKTEVELFRVPEAAFSEFSWFFYFFFNLIGDINVSFEH